METASAHSRRMSTMSAVARILRSKLASPCSGASIAIVRILYGAILAWESLHYLSKDLVLEYASATPVRIPYPGFEWVAPLPGTWVYAHWLAIGILAVLLALGLFYRITISLLAALMWWLFLLEQSAYLNHMYFACLLTTLLVFVPADACLSIRNRTTTATIPFWCVWTLRLQVGVVYFFGGIAKINTDWLNGYPLKLWMLNKPRPLALGFVPEQHVAMMMSYSGLILDLLAAPLLMWRRTRIWMFIAIVAFHLTNDLTFSIGMFPWLAIAVTTVFFPPNWPIAWRGLSQPTPASPTRPMTAAWFSALAVYVAFQCLFPLRHWLYPGNVAWNEDGHMLSWRMKLRGKDGYARYRVKHPDGREDVVHPTGFLTPQQGRKLASRPDAILTVAHHIAERAENAYGTPVAVYADVFTIVNGRAPQRYVDPSVDLTTKSTSPLAPTDWLMPFDASAPYLSATEYYSQALQQRRWD